MKRLYWRPQKCSPSSLVVVAILAALGMVAVEVFQVRGDVPLGDEKLVAANLAADCFDVIRQERLARGYSLDAEIDPTLSGVLGLANSPVTSIAGHLESKQASANPNFAAAVVQMLYDTGVRCGDQAGDGVETQHGDAHFLTGMCPIGEPYPVVRFLDQFSEVSRFISVRITRQQCCRSVECSS